jgi:hypothetical protein
MLFCLFICTSFNDAFSVAKTAKRRMKGLQVNDELDSWHNFKVLSRHVTRGTEKKHKNPQSG